MSIFSRLKQASGLEVQEWLHESIPELTGYQKEMIDDEFLRDSEFYFYKDADEKVSFWWRLTIIFFPIIWVLLFIGLPFNMIITAQWGYGKTFGDKFYSPWVRKLKLD